MMRVMIKGDEDNGDDGDDKEYYIDLDMIITTRMPESV